MKKLKAALVALTKALGIQNVLHARAVRKMKARHAGQKKAGRQAQAAQERADRLRREGHLARAERKDRKSERLGVKAERERTRAIFWKGRVRVIAKRIHGIETDIDKVKAEIRELGPRVHLKDSKVVGGTFAQRWCLSNLTSVRTCLNGRRRNAYSQAGSPDIWHPYGPGPAPGHRDDCSSYTTSQALATGAEDPNGLDFSGAGYTGTLIHAHGAWKEVSLPQMIRAGQGYIVYGSGTGHHVECYCPSASGSMRTVGHGSAPVDFATVHMFGAGEVERYFVYDPSEEASCSTD